MNWYDYIESEIKKIIPEDYPIYFYWNYKKAKESKYVVFQTEQLNLKSKLNRSWIDFMDKSVNVYDYSSLNMDFYSSTFLPYYPNESSKFHNNPNTEIDILFYGYQTPRRKKIIKKYNAVVIESRNDMKTMKDYIKKSKYVLSVGAYNDRYADPLRVVPALNFGANILMERTEEGWLNEYLLKNMKNRITFLDEYEG